MPPTGHCAADRRQGLSEKRLPRSAVVKEPGIDLVLAEPHEVPHLHVAAELVLQDPRIRLADPEDDQIAGIAEDALPDAVLELVQVLMGEDERQAVLPGLGED